MRKVWIRIYSPPTDISVSHSFYVGHMPSGLSPRLASFSIFEDTTFSELRRRIEWKQDCDMSKRTIVYCELLDVMNRMRDKDASEEKPHDFRFGTLHKNENGKDNSSFPAIVKKEVEDEIIAQIIDLDNYKDLILVPLPLIRYEDT